MLYEDDTMKRLAYEMDKAVISWADAQDKLDALEDLDSKA